MIELFLIFHIIAACQNNESINFKTENIDIPKPKKEIELNSKWWSNSFFGNVHKRICKKAFEQIDLNEYPDLRYYITEILDGCGDEDGHPTPQSNGGDVKNIWFGTKSREADRERIMGVLFNYKSLKWNEAYENLGAIIHLTQDQAVPAHAANIKHFLDQFERFYESDNDIRLTEIDIAVPEDLNPWEYYLFVQKNTRLKLKEWIDPENGLPYWEENPNSLPLDQDNTLGPWGHYGGGKDHFMKQECQTSVESEGYYECTYTPKSPQIRERQLTLATIATEKLLKSASKKLPPVIRVDNHGSSVEITVYENRCNTVSYQTDKGLKGSISFDKNFPFSKKIKLTKDFFTIEFTDCDGNSVKEKI